VTSYPEGHDIWLPLLPHRKLLLIAEILLAYLRVRRQINRTDLREVLASLRHTRRRYEVSDPDEAKVTGYRLGWAVQKTLRWVPGDTRCLTQSLALTILLTRRGIPSRVIIGVRTGETFGAHAWVEHDGQALLPALPMGRAFQRLAQV
jgi:transglutaminase-like putative cysteine protease